MKYRPDIDGLRAVAVIPVVLYHFGFSYLFGYKFVIGGFVGVDIFFVISGYLISKIIYEEMSKGTYGILNFYNRRIKRIFPVLVVIYLICIAIGMATLLPVELHEQSKSIIASLFFVSNISFSMMDSYFDAALQNNPLLHTWSLSVEEQFYIIFPLLIYLIKRFEHKTRLIILTVMTFASFSWSVYAVQIYPTSAYYLVQSRAWELLLGSLLAISNVRMLPTTWMRESLSLIGLLAIVYSINRYSSVTPFPGMAAMLPCLGALAIIYSNNTDTPTLVGRVLGSYPFKFIGLISYSLYLWHWPLVVFLKMDHQLSTLNAFLLTVLCLILATLSWRYIEKPFRTMNWKIIGRYGIVASAAISAAAVAGLSIGSPSISNSLWRPSHEAQEFSTYIGLPAPTMGAGTCFLTSKFNNFNLFNQTDCLNKKAGKYNVLVVGDSHSAQLVSGLRTTYPEINFSQASASGCLPLLNLAGIERCTKLMDYVFNSYLPHNHMDAIVLAARWPHTDVDDFISSAAYLKKFASVVYVVGPTLEFRGMLPRLLAWGEMTQTIGYVDEHRNKYIDKIDAAFKKSSMPVGVRYVSLRDLFCDQRCVYVTSTGAPINFDDNHLSVEASTEVAKSLAADFPIHE